MATQTKKKDENKGGAVIAGLLVLGGLAAFLFTRKSGGDGGGDGGDGTLADLTGTVIDSVTGGGVPGASVQVAGKSGTSDSSGTFSFTGIDPGAYTILASKEDYFSAEEPVVLAAGTNHHSIQLVPSANIYGQVSNAVTGGRVAGAQVTLGGVPVIVTDSVGIFGITDLDLGSYELRVSAGGYLEYVEQITLAQGRNFVTIELVPLPTEQLLLDYEGVSGWDSVTDAEWYGREFKLPVRAELTRIEMPLCVRLPYDTAPATITLEIRGAPVDGSPQLPALIYSVTIPTPDLANYPSYTWVDFPVPAGLVLEKDTIYSWWFKSDPGTTFRVSRPGDYLGLGNRWCRYLVYSNPPLLSANDGSTRPHRIWGIPQA